MRLERREGSFGKLIADIQEESLSAAVAIIGPNHPVPFLEAKIMDAGLRNLTVPLLAYVVECAGLETGDDDDDKSTKSRGKQAKSISFEQHLTGLIVSRRVG